MDPRCSLCDSKGDFLDSMCEPCDALFLDSLSRISSRLPGDTEISELFRLAGEQVKERLEMHRLVARGGPVEVFLYPFGQNVRYVKLGEIPVEGSFATVILTIEVGKGALSRRGLHAIITHHESFKVDGEGLERDRVAPMIENACEDLVSFCTTHSYCLGFPMDRCDPILKVAQEWVALGRTRMGCLP